MLINEDLTKEIIGAAIEVHKALGPGLLESAYEACLCREMELREISFERQVHLPLNYKGMDIDCGYRMDLVVADAVVVELKCVEKLMPVHEAQLLSYLRISGKRVGLLFNFNVTYLREGMIRRVL